MCQAILTMPSGIVRIAVIDTVFLAKSLIKQMFGFGSLLG